MKSRICLIRHGITEGNKKKLYYGHSDIDLAEEGITELKELVSSGLYPDGEGADFYTTDLKRTQQTLKLIYGEREFQMIPDLKEINFGDFEMKSYGELKEIEEYRQWLKNPGPGPGAAQRREHQDILWQDKKRLRGAEEEACSEGIVHETFRQGGPEHSHMPWRNNFGSDGGGLSGEKG